MAKQEPEVVQSVMAPSAPEPLGEGHEFNVFDCGNDDLNNWLRKFARKNARDDTSRTYVVCVDNQVVAYYCLAVGSVDHKCAPRKWRHGRPNPIPMMVLGRLAVDRDWQGKYVGSGLLKDAVKRTLEAAEIAGIHGIVVHAISDEAKRFYEERGFEVSPIAEMTMMVTLKDAAANLE
jgi:predicted N-acetyltransferase YhbS